MKLRLRVENIGLTISMWLERHGFPHSLWDDENLLDIERFIFCYAFGGFMVGWLHGFWVCGENSKQWLETKLFILWTESGTEHQREMKKLRFQYHHWAWPHPTRLFLSDVSLCQSPAADRWRTRFLSILPQLWAGWMLRKLVETGWLAVISLSPSVHVLYFFVGLNDTWPVCLNFHFFSLSSVME